MRVITDDRQHQLSAAAAPRDEAVDRVLDGVPEGWAASLEGGVLTAQQLEALNLQPGEIRKIWQDLRRMAPYHAVL